MCWTRVFAVAAACGTSAHSYGQIAYQPVALTGQIAPDSPPGVAFGRLGFDAVSGRYAIPAISPAGNIAFRFSLEGSGVDSSNDYGVWTSTSDGLHLLARQGAQAPDAGAGSAYDLKSLPLISHRSIINDSGQVLLRSALQGTGVTTANKQGMWLGEAGNVRLVTRTGNPAPGGGSFSGFFFNTDMNALGEIAFTSDGSNGLGGIWAGQPNTPQLVMQARNPTIGVAPGTVFTYLGPFTLDNLGRVSFHSNYGIWGGAVSGFGLWAGPPDAVHPVAYTGLQVPDLPAGTAYSGVFESSASRGGRIAFDANFLLPGGALNWGLFIAEPDGSVHLALQSGHPAPGTPSGTSLRAFPGHTIDDDGGLIVTTILSGPGVTTNNDHAVYTFTDHSLQLLAREGEPAPGTSALFSEGFLFRGNPRGQVALWANLKGTGIDDSNDLALYLTDIAGQLHLVAREGDPLLITPGDARTVDQLSMLTLTSHADDHHMQFLSDDGRLVFAASFTDGTSGVFTASVPEPRWSLVFLLALSGVVFGRSRT